MNDKEITITIRGRSPSEVKAKSIMIDVLLEMNIENKDKAKLIAMVAS